MSNFSADLDDTNFQLIFYVCLSYLNMTNVKENHYGSYRCIAANQFGTIFQEMTLSTCIPFSSLELFEIKGLSQRALGSIMRVFLIDYPTFLLLLLSPFLKEFVVNTRFSKKGYFVMIYLESSIFISWTQTRLILQ